MWKLGIGKSWNHAVKFLIHWTTFEYILKYQFWKNATSEKWNSVGLNTFKIGTLMPCPFTGPSFTVWIQTFRASPKIWLHIVPLQKLSCHHKKQFYWMQIILNIVWHKLFVTATIRKFMVWYKKFGPDQNILEPVKGQGINVLNPKNRKYVSIMNDVCSTYKYLGIYF